MLPIKKTLKHPKACKDKRQLFQDKIAAYTQLARPIVYIDESGFAHDMPRNYGYSLKGERCFGTHDWGAKGRTNAIGALLGKKLLTIGLFNCNINTEAFNAWIKQELLPILPPKSVIVMDNASFHKGKWLRESIELKGHALEYLPTYSPDLNPIEHKWAQAKSLKRKYDYTVDELFTHLNL